MYVSIGEVSKLTGISIVTLRRYDRLHKLKAKFRTPGNHRRYLVNEVLSFFGLAKESKPRINVCYARVSSSDQKEDLTRQAKKLEIHAENTSGILTTISIKDLGSGINYKKVSFHVSRQLVAILRIETFMRLAT